MFRLFSARRLARIVLAGFGVLFFGFAVPTALAHPPAQGSQISLTADKTTLTPDQCATLYYSIPGDWSMVTVLGFPWQAQGFRGAPIKESKQVCPTTTTTYSVSGIYAAGKKEASIKITVSAPAPQKPPSQPAQQPRAPQSSQPQTQPRPQPQPQPQQPPASSDFPISMNADNFVIYQGECTNLYWDVSLPNAKVWIDGREVAVRDQAQVCPPETTTYTLIAENRDAKIGMRTRIDVIAPPPAPVVDFQTDKGTLTLGECTILRWNAQNVDEVYINYAQVDKQGTHKICPKESVAYVLDIISPYGPAEYFLPIEVVQSQATSPEIPNLKCPVNPGGDGGKSGRVLILLQGLGTKSKDQAQVWSQIVSNVSDLYSGIVYFSYNDIPVYGSQDTQNGIFDNHIPQLYDLIENCGKSGKWQSFDLIGHSMGGVVAWEYVKKYGLISSSAGLVKHVITMDSPVNGSFNLYMLNHKLPGIPQLVVDFMNQTFTGLSAEEMAASEDRRKKNTDDNKKVAELLSQKGTGVWTITNVDDWAITLDDAVIPGMGLRSAGVFGLGRDDLTSSADLGHKVGHFQIFDTKQFQAVGRFLRTALSP